jgi:FlaA1/EpsC-like NDP-sugar epimerase
MALFDDDPKKRGVSIHGVRVEGGVEDVKSFAEVVPIDTAIVAIPSANGAQMRRINMALRELDLSIKTLPPLLEIMDTSPVLSQLRDLDISDLLGREEIRIDTNQVHDLIHGKVVLVTGAGGSIGGELCCQVLNRGPRRLILLERSENNLFHIHRRLFSECLNLGDTVLLPVLNDVRHFDNLLGILERYRPSVVFHAAAHKHVYMQELNPLECFKNNVGGIQAVARACDQTGVDLCLLISTDKAVGPTSVMGATKRVCEIYCQAYSRISSTKFICVRFGNVLGSEVSVVPIFLEQIASGGPVTVTHPDVTRYFMSIPEAVTLVLQAAVIGKSGQIMLLEMGDPIKIVDLARQLINLAGKNEREIEIQFTGLKPGEKLVEELACSGDVCQETNHNKIKVFQGFIENPRDVIAQIDSCVENAFSRGADFRVRKALLRLVPEYQPAIQVLTSEHAEDRAFTYPDPFHTGASAGLQA